MSVGRRTEELFFLNLNMKVMIMSTRNSHVNLKITFQLMENVTTVYYLGSLIYNNGDCS